MCDLIVISFGSEEELKDHLEFSVDEKSKHLFYNITSILIINLLIKRRHRSYGVCLTQYHIRKLGLSLTSILLF